MLEFILEVLFNASSSGLALVEFVVALGLGFFGYKLYNNVKTPTDSWDEFLKILSFVMMGLGILDALIVIFL